MGEIIPSPVFVVVVGWVGGEHVATVYYLNEVAFELL